MAGPTPIQALVLWALVARGGEAPQKDIKPVPDKKNRDAIVGLGLVSTAKGPRGSVLLELTDRGWAWAADNFHAPLSTQSTAGAVVLADFLRRLGAFLAARDLTLAEFIRPVAGATAVAGAAAAAAASLPERVRAAYLASTGGAVRRGVRLAELQARLPDVTRDALHHTLLRMQAQGDAGLMRQEDPTKLTAEDHAHVLRVGGEPRHILWLD